MKSYILIMSLLLASTASARENIQIVGSSTVLPFATIAAESFAENFDTLTPVVEGGGTGAGIKKFCSGVGEDTVDIVNASRKMKDEEKATCASNGVNDITEVRIGYDGIVFASDVNGKSFALTPSIIYKAINEDYNFTNWNEIDVSLPDQNILMIIPGTKHGTREVFDQKIIIQGCKDVGDFDKFSKTITDPKEVEKKCNALRSNTVIEVDGDYTETLNRMAADINAIGVFGLSFYENNMDKLQVATVNDISPSIETIADGSYPVSRPLYFYIKDAHIGSIPNLLEFAQYFVSDEMAGPDGSLVQNGLVPDPELKSTQESLNK